MIWTDDGPVPIFPPPYEPEVVRCYGCSTTAKAEKLIPDGERGVYVRLTRTNAEVMEEVGD